jgi:two-component system sensor histidine kinase PhoQ
MELPLIHHPLVGERVFQYITIKNGVKLSTYSFGVSWENSKGKQLRYTFRVIESLNGFYAQLRRFRRSLWGWLGGAALLLLAVQGTILRWGLAPLRRVTDDLTEIESGRARKLSGDYPKELRGLTDNLNALIASAQAHLIRYRDSLGNLAHSLKTPLAVLRGVVENTNSGPEQHRTIQEQVKRMTEIIEYQLQRASAAGRTVLAAPVSVLAKTNQVVAALTKVYAEKTVDCSVTIGKDLMFYGDEGDLLEILGNLTDNAFKWCRHRVTISARPLESFPDRPARLELRIEDDGNGIPQEVKEQIQQRGKRADPSIAGHGLGLAMVWEMLETYHGELTFQQSTLGGAAVVLHL